MDPTLSDEFAMHVECIRDAVEDFMTATAYGNQHAAAKALTRLLYEIGGST